MNLGSSGLEILGALQQTVISYRGEIENLLGPARSQDIDDVIAFVDKAFGRKPGAR